MPAPRELSQKIPCPQAKAGMQKPQGGGKIFSASPLGCAGGMVIDETEECNRDIYE